MYEPLPSLKKKKSGPNPIEAEIEGHGFLDFMAAHQANTAGAS